MSVMEPHRAADDVPERTHALPHEGQAATGDDFHQSRVLTAESPITYLYLTFDTPLPSANSTIASIATPSAPPNEPDLHRYLNPTQWSAYRKAYNMVLCCLASAISGYSAGSFSPPISIMEAEFDASRTALLTGLTTFCMGFAIAPMVLAPFSEIIGRYSVFAVSGLVFVVFQIVCGFVPDLAGMLIARFIVGVGGSVFSTVIGGVIADLWGKEGRNTPMAIFSGSVLVGTGLGPMVCSIITYRYGDDGEKWKWVFWHQIIMGGVLTILIVVFFQESRGSVVLSRKAKALNKWYDAREKAGYYGVWLQDSASVVGEGSSGDDSEGMAEKTGSEDEDKKVMTDLPRPRSGAVTTVSLTRLRWRVGSDDERASIGKMISISLYRPFFLLCTEPVVFFFSLWVSFAWAILYLTFASIPYIFETVYGWNVEESGYVFASIIVGAFLSTIIGVLQDELLKNPQWRAENGADDSSYDERRRSQQQRGPRAKFYAILRRHFPVEAPESRLYFTCITATLLPIGLFLFGFTSTPSTPWISPAIAICLATMGIYSVYLATFNYLADVYHMYASSALAAQSCCRNALGGVFPLFALPLFKNLGNSGAGGLLGGIALVLTFVPWVLVFYGSRIRARSKFALVLEKAD
ncbi:hypothetical protein VPNG_04343 [Cytospora leucostoma]|uniref:Major facilitator superfamily (MFS) profile domain-containing protein n=1 Tax=Cytospora leucostoma TaxID=1230097 RepID=A0A423XDM8_9PEZI|nr:hypothetical protein VPNG_04343 [Cytospora leucostoma]